MCNSVFNFLRSQSEDYYESTLDMLLTRFHLRARSECAHAGSMFSRTKGEMGEYVLHNVAICVKNCLVQHVKILLASHSIE